MSKKKGKDDSGKTVERRYYDPAKRPYPRRVEAVGGSGPTGNSRQQRRARERMSFILQLDLARSQGFPVPDSMPASVEGNGGALEWIAIWEACYKLPPKPKTT